MRTILQKYPLHKDNDEELDALAQTLFSFHENIATLECSDGVAKAIIERVEKYPKPLTYPGDWEEDDLRILGFSALPFFGALATAAQRMASSPPQERMDVISHPLGQLNSRRHPPGPLRS